MNDSPNGFQQMPFTITWIILPPGPRGINILGSTGLYFESFILPRRARRTRRVNPLGKMILRDLRDLRGVIRKKSNGQLGPGMIKIDQLPHLSGTIFCIPGNKGNSKKIKQRKPKNRPSRLILLFKFD